jgi:hypothetical protein
MTAEARCGSCSAVIRRRQGFGGTSRPPLQNTVRAKGDSTESGFLRLFVVGRWNYSGLQNTVTDLVERLDLKMLLARCPFDKLRVPSQSREGQCAQPLSVYYARLSSWRCNAADTVPSVILRTQ